MRARSALCVLSVLSALALAGCGGSKPPAEEPESAGAAEDQEGGEKASGSEDSEAKTDDTNKAEEKKAEPESSEPKVERTARDILTAPDVTFMFSFNQSEPKEKAEAKCSATAKDDPKKMALCMKKASSKFQADGMQFKKDDKGNWVWLTLRRKGSTLTTLHKIPFEFGAEKPTSVTIKPTGRDTGTQPMKPPSEVTIEVPNEFSIALDDPTHGKMVYEAKIGITSQDAKGP